MNSEELIKVFLVALVARKAANAAREKEQRAGKVFKEALQVAWETAKEEEGTGEVWKEVLQIAWEAERKTREEIKEAFEAEEKALAAEAAALAALGAAEPVSTQSF